MQNTKNNSNDGFILETYLADRIAGSSASRSTAKSSAIRVKEAVIHFFTNVVPLIWSLLTYKGLSAVPLADRMRSIGTLSGLAAEQRNWVFEQVGLADQPKEAFKTFVKTLKEIDAVKRSDVIKVTKELIVDNSIFLPEERTSGIKARLMKKLSKILPGGANFVLHACIGKHFPSGLEDRLRAIEAQVTDLTGLKNLQSLSNF